MANAMETYYKHYAYGRTLVAKERLLGYELGSGWDPLSAFLGKEVPDVLFPRVNESAIMQEKVDIVIVRTAVTALTNLALGVGGIVTLAFAVCWQWKRI
jgi:Sulfotransferase domain